MAYIQELTDESGESVYPVTKTNAVYDTNGHRLSDSMLTVGEPVEKLEDIKINADTLGGHSYEEINQNLTAQDGEPFRYAKQDGKRGYIVNEEGADTFYPFKSTDIFLRKWYGNATTYNDFTRLYLAEGEERYTKLSYTSFRGAWFRYTTNKQTEVVIDKTKAGGDNGKTIQLSDGEYFTYIVLFPYRGDTQTKDAYVLNLLIEE